MSRRKRMMDKRGPHVNKYQSGSHAMEAAEEIKRREKGLETPYKKQERIEAIVQEKIQREEKPEGLIETTIQETQQNPEGLIKILYVTDQPHQDKVETKLRKAGFECCVFYTRKEAENSIPGTDYSGAFIENLRMGRDKGTVPDYSEGIGLARAVKAAGLPLIVLAEDIFLFIERVKDLGSNDRVIQRLSDSTYYIPAARGAFKRCR